MHRPPDKSLWTGRLDPGETRLHQVVQFEDSAKVALIGFASDEGVRRNQGRPGAADGPTALRKQLANLAWNPEITVLDLGDVVCEGTDLESAQAEYADVVTQALKQEMLVVGLGGGHEISWASHMGLRRAFPEDHIGILNFDAHFDLRESDRPTSGTPFLQALRLAPDRTSYFAVGVSDVPNHVTQLIEDRHLDIRSISQDLCTELNKKYLLGKLIEYRQLPDHIHLSIDLDVFPGWVTPGVSAPATLGVKPEVVLSLLGSAYFEKTRVIDIAELNPTYDRDNQTARFAAKVVKEAIDEYYDPYEQPKGDRLAFTDVRLMTLVGDEGLGIVEDGILLVDSGIITYAGPRSEAPDFGGTHMRKECGNRWITPGLIDCHTHFLFGGDRAQEHELRLSGTPYEDIAQKGGGILSTVKATRDATERDLLIRADQEYEGFYTATLDIKSGYGLDVETELRLLRAAQRLKSIVKSRIVVGYLGAHAVPPEFKDDPDGYIDLVVDLIPQIAKEGLADYVDAFCENVAFSKEQVARVFDAAKKAGLPVRLHADQLSPMGAAGLAADYNALSADHLEYTSEADIRKMAKSGTVAVLLPLATLFLRQTQLPPVELFREHHVPMAVATDFNPGTAPRQDIQLAMTMACVNYGLTVEEAWRGVTVNAAKALGLGDQIGRLVPGYKADFQLWSFNHPREFLFGTARHASNGRYFNGKLVF